MTVSELIERLGKMPAGAPVRVKKGKNHPEVVGVIRGGGDEPAFVELSLQGTGVLENRYQSDRRKILEYCLAYLQLNGIPPGQTEICNELDLEPNIVQGRLQRMDKDGDIRRAGVGRFALLKDADGNSLHFQVKKA